MTNLCLTSCAEGREESDKLQQARRLNSLSTVFRTCINGLGGFACCNGTEVSHNPAEPFAVRDPLTQFQRSHFYSVPNGEETSCTLWPFATTERMATATSSRRCN